MKFAAVSLLALLAAATSYAQQPVIVEDDSALPSLIPLFISCDLQEEFVTPAIDARELFWMESPVSREGARMLTESRRRWKVAQVPLVLDSATAMGRETLPSVCGPFGGLLTEPVLTSGHVGVGCHQSN